MPTEEPADRAEREGSTIRRHGGGRRGGMGGGVVGGMGGMVTLQ